MFNTVTSSKTACRNFTLIQVLYKTSSCFSLHIPKHHRQDLILGFIFFSLFTGPAIIRSRYPLRANEWTKVVAERRGREGMLTVNDEESVNGKWLSCTLFILLSIDFMCVSVYLFELCLGLQQGQVNYFALTSCLINPCLYHLCCHHGTL